MKIYTGICGSQRKWFEHIGHVHEKADESNLTGTDHCVKEKSGEKGKVLHIEGLKKWRFVWCSEPLLDKVCFADQWNWHYWKLVRHAETTLGNTPTVLYFSKCPFCTSSITITWGLIRNMDSLTLWPHPNLLNQNLHSNKMSSWFICTLVLRSTILEEIMPPLWGSEWVRSWLSRSLGKGMIYQGILKEQHEQRPWGVTAIKQQLTLIEPGIVLGT